MVAKVLKPNVQDLQKDVVELLEKISKRKHLRYWLMKLKN